MSNSNNQGRRRSASSSNKSSKSASKASKTKMKDYYEVLGVEFNASQEQIAKAFRTLGSKHHPDRFNTDDEKEKNSEIFRDISNAYSVLKNKESREEYDRRRMCESNGGGDEQFGINNDEFIRQFMQADPFAHFERFRQHQSSLFEQFMTPFDDFMMHSPFDNFSMDNDPFFGESRSSFSSPFLNPSRNLSNARRSQSNHSTNHIAQHNGHRSNHIQQHVSNNVMNSIPQEFHDHIKNDRNFQADYIDENQNRVRVSYKTDKKNNGSYTKSFSYSYSNF